MTRAEPGPVRWQRWGPYVSERQWGTVREDYSPGGTAWDYLPHDHARSRAYRWGEDGIAGFSDAAQLLCLSLALWNRNDPILKERLFGLTNAEGNHGEDVKELYYYLDATPSHSYLKMLYKYPQAAFPYAQLVAENRRRGKDDDEFELLDTGVFDDDRYFDVFVEYAQAAPDDILMCVTVHNRGPQAHPVVLLPQLFFRNTWSWQPGSDKPRLSATADGGVRVEHAVLGEWRLDIDSKATLLFCNNETNARRHFDQPDAPGFFKDAFHEALIHGNAAAVNPDRSGTKAGLSVELSVPAGGSQQLRLRLRPATAGAKGVASTPFADFDRVLTQRRAEADAFYDELQRSIADTDARAVQRQALAGMIWSKQFFHYNVQTWLQGDPLQPAPPPERKGGRNHDWTHVDTAEVMSMPDKWEYPWFAAWDLAFHCLPLALVDAGFAKAQLLLLAREWYMHPNGQLPAYEWAFGDVNPPVHAWAALRVFQIDRKQRRRDMPGDPGDLPFLERMFQKLLLNFTWWVNRKDDKGRNIFQGGFLGLDNISCFDRSAPLPTGGFINQVDGTSWMAMYCLNLLGIAIELAQTNPVYEDIATKFLEHFLSIAAAINRAGDDPTGLWDEDDQFYYDHLSLPDGRNLPLKIQSIVGLIPLFSVQVLEPDVLARLPAFSERLEWVMQNRPEMAALISNWKVPGHGNRRLLSLLRGHRTKALLRQALDESRFLSDFGVRSLSKALADDPFRFDFEGTHYDVAYWPAESRSALFGGNSNWRGPVWMPLNFLLIESLQKFHYFYGDDFTVECPTGSGHQATLREVADELSRRLSRLFLKGADGQRPVLKVHPKLATDPHFRDHLLFHEYFDGDTGRGVGASHQTGWTGAVAKLLQPRDTGADDTQVSGRSRWPRRSTPRQ
ncbi:MAG: glucosidase [Burkholderiaceae bacterium]